MHDYEPLLAALRARRSIRRFRGDRVSREDIDRLLEAARCAPSNHNRQPWSFLVLDEPAAITELASVVEQGLRQRLAALPATGSSHADDFVRHATVFANAPVVIAALHRHPSAIATALLKDVPDASLVSGDPLSVAMAVQNILLIAPALGLGTCVLTGPLAAGQTVADALRIPPGCSITCLIAVGVPDEAPAAPRRKELSQIREFRNAPH